MKKSYRCFFKTLESKSPLIAIIPFSGLIFPRFPITEDDIIHVSKGREFSQSYGISVHIFNS